MQQAVKKEIANTIVQLVLVTPMHTSAKVQLHQEAVEVHRTAEVIVQAQEAHIGYSIAEAVSKAETALFYSDT